MQVKDRVLAALEASRGTYLSGQALAQQLQVSRNAVWKAISQLRESGYPIQAVSHRGYCLDVDSPLLSPQSIARHLTVPGLQVEVAAHEPRLALDGGADGLDFYRAISEKWKAALAPGGRLYFEVGIGQADAVLRIMRAQGFGDIQVVKDHNDIPRVVFGTLCGEVYSE